MAPHQSFADPLRGKLGERLKISQVEQNIFQHGKPPKVMRCTSVNYSEEEESKEICYNETDYLRSTTCRKKPWWFSPAVWPGIIPSLDPTDQGLEERKRKEEKIVLETEDRKKAVENDDQTESFESAILGRPSKLDGKPWTLDLPSKDFNCGMAELGCPYPIQESTDDFQAESVILGIVNPPSKIDSCEIEEWAGKDELDSQEDVAHVKLYDDVEIPTISRKRHAVRKIRKNCWELTDPDLDLPCKKKRTCRRAQTRKAKKTKKVARNKVPASVEDIDELIAQFIETDKRLKETLPLDTTFKQPYSPVNTEPKDSDSGVHSQSNNNGSASAQGNSGGSGGSSTEEEGSGKHSGGNSGDGGDDGKDEKDKAPWWCFPGGENTVGKVKKKKEKERKKMEESCEERMDLDAPDTSRFQFLPSQIDHTEQCHHAGKDLLMGADVLTDTGMLDFSHQDLQHSCYCSRNVCDVNRKCKAVKEELKHMGAHNKLLTCARCKNTHNIVKQHATFCQRNGCRVPDCNQLRNGWNGPPVKHGPPFQPQIPVFNALGQHWARPPIVTKPRMPAIDGGVIFRNSTILPERHFSEHIDYHVQRLKKLGEGSNGDIYEIIVQADRNLEWVVKETRYEMPLEEIEVYKAVGFHEHIVKIFGATFRGSDGKANVFMEKCDQSLYDYINAKESRLPVDEAMFYWLQVLDAVHYLHNLPVPIIHKDIKAKNVVLTSEYSRAKLCDLDSAIRLPDELTEAGLKPLGTKGFIAPEVREKKRHGRPADIYSLACLLIEETVGVPSVDTLDDKIDQLRQLYPDLADLVIECTKTRPEDRPTAGQLVQCSALQKFRKWQRS